MEYRGYNIKALGTFPMVEIRAKGQGQVPHALLGLFTTVTEAQKAIDGSLEGMIKKRGKSNGKTKGSGTD